MKKLPVFCTTLVAAIIISMGVISRATAQGHSLSVDATKTVNHFSKEMVGVQAPQWVHIKAGWGKPFLNEVPNLQSVYTKAGIGLIRYGGGLESNAIGWERTPQKPRTYNGSELVGWSPSKNNFHSSFQNQIDTTLHYDYHYGTDEIDSLGAFSKNTGIPIMLQINVNHHDPAMWADLLHYANVENNYGIKYLELSNELDLEYSQGKTTVTPSEYGKRVKEYLTALKAVDPNIKVISGVSSIAHNGFIDGHGLDAWSEYLYEGAKARGANGQKSDGISHHWYPRCSSQGGPATVQQMYQFDNPSPNRGLWGAQEGRLWAKTAPQGIEQKILQPFLPGGLQGITELNFDACDYTNAPFNSNHMGAVRFADVLGRLAYHGLDFNTWFEGLGGESESYAAIFTLNNTPNPTLNEIFLRPTFSTLYMYGNYFGNQMVQTQSTNEADLSIWAAKQNNDPNTLTLMITNFTDQPIQTTVDINGFTVGGGKKYVMSSTNPTSGDQISKSKDHTTTINGVKLQYATLPNTTVPPQEIGSFTPEQFTESFPPYSVTAIQLQKQVGIPSDTPPTQSPETTTAPITTAQPTNQPTTEPTATPSTSPSKTPVPTSTAVCPLNGDIDCSGAVNAIDLTLLLTKLGTGDATADLDKSVYVNAIDLSLLLQNLVKI